MWAETVAIGAAFLVLAGLIGHLSGFYHWSPRWSPLTLATAIVAPAFLEELCFRAALPPDPKHKSTRQTWLTRGAFATALFIIWHPAQSWLGAPWATEAFVSWPFLAIVALLGATTTWLYRRTKSLWPCVAVHWVLVALWKSLFGG